jgi:general secretion pathway protein G
MSPGEDAMTNRQRNSGFTLVEILIVVIILGILASIVIPQFANATDGTRRANVGDTIRTLNNQILMYRLQHRDQLPNLLTNWNPLTVPTANSDGVLIASYLHAAPVNALNSRNNVVDGTGSAASGTACGFVYDYNGGSGNGQIFATDSDGKTIYVPASP